jgi:hypothetical protein
MQKLEEEIFKTDTAEEAKRTRCKSAVRICSRREKEIEKPLQNLIMNYRQLAQSVKGLTNQKITSLSLLTRKMILKSRNGNATQESNKEHTLVQEMTVFN